MLRAISQNKILKHKTDVLVVGAGLAGIMAAISAAEAGAKVCLISSGPVCSGSSFYPGTWGFGLVGPNDQQDEGELKETICRVGEGIVDRQLVSDFVSGISESIQYLAGMGVTLKEAVNPDQQEFIPCFDHKCRSWHGIIKEEARPVFLERLKALQVELFAQTEIMELIQEEGVVCGALAIGAQSEVIQFACNSLVLATGGLGGLFQYHLTPGDVTGRGHALALKAGAKLVNTEFLQMMPGFLSPAYGTVFNEKIFRYTQSEVFSKWSPAKRQQILTLRSGHGPYTSRLESGLVDEAIMEGWEKSPQGVLVSYDERISQNQPEFVETYFSWLKREKGVTVKDSICLGIFAHASNGGIYIDSHGFTGIAGLYACGECTGGMHGADRIGGLSTANGLVFGRAAGTAAAYGAQGACARQTSTRSPFWTIGNQSEDAVEQVRAGRKELRIRMSGCAMIGRSRERSIEMLDWIEQRGVKWNQGQAEGMALDLYREKSRLDAELAAAWCMMTAILMREESRGSHHRNDFPQKDPNMTNMLAVFYRNAEKACEWIEQ